MPCGWEGNRRSGVAQAMCHRLQWFIHLRAHGLRKEDEHPAYTLLILQFSTEYWHYINFITVTFTVKDTTDCSSPASAVLRLPSAVRTATPAFDFRSSGLFCGRPGGLELVTRLPVRSVTCSFDSFRRDLKSFLFSFY